MKNAVLHKVCTDHLKYLSTITFLDIPEDRYVQYYRDGNPMSGVEREEFTTDERKSIARNVSHIARLLLYSTEESYAPKI